MLYELINNKMLKENSNVLPGVWPQITVLNGRMNGSAACFAAYLG